MIWEPTLGIEEPEQMPKHMSIFGRLSEYINDSRKVFEGNNEKGNQMSTTEREQLDSNNYIWEGESSGPLEIWKTPQNNVNEIDFMLEKISEATNTTDLPLKKIAETKEAVEGNEEERTHEIFLAYRDKDSSFEEEDLLWLIITTERPGSDALYVLVRSSAIGQGQQIDKFIKYTNKASTILLADSSGEPWSKQLEISDKTKDFTEVKIDPNQSWGEEDTNALEELNRHCSSYMENVYSEDKGTYFKPQIKKLSLLEESDAYIGDSGVHQVNKLATTGFDDEILSNLIECEGILL